MFKYTDRDGAWVFDFQTLVSKFQTYIGARTGIEHGNVILYISYSIFKLRGAQTGIKHRYLIVNLIIIYC